MSKHINIFVLLIAVGISIVLFAFVDATHPLVTYPRAWTVDGASPITTELKYLARTFEIGSVKLSTITRSIGWFVSQPLHTLNGILATGFTFYHEGGGKTIFPPLPWLGVTLAFTFCTYYFVNLSIALFCFSSFTLLAFFGLWEATMMTLSSVVIAVIIGVISGILLGLLGCKNALINAVLQPIYDIMQTLPLFSYLVPMILFFGFGPIAALMSTVIFAMPPMAKITTQALKEVSTSTKDLGAITGCNAWQKSFLVMLPSARKKLLLGVNQVIMLSLAVVIVASLIGAGGLGGDVLKALKSMRLGNAVVAGLGITAIAIILDRISYGVALRRITHDADIGPWHVRHRLALACLLAITVTIALSPFIPAVHTWPENLKLSTGTRINEAVSWLGTTYRTEIFSFRDTVIIWVLKPTKLFLLDFPWMGWVIMMGAVGWALGGLRLALLGSVVFAAIAVFGYWKPAMISLYMVFLSVLLTAVFGIGLGILSGLNDRAHNVLISVVDILQTLPSFVYLIPVVMIFSIGDFPALLAIMLYAVAPAIRFTDAGIRGVPQNLVEGAKMSGCNGLQLTTLVKLPLALPTILLGLNQVVMMAFGMLVITSLVGTRGLEELTLLAIAQVDPGKGLLAGLSIGGMAIVFDRFMRAANKKIAYQLGVPVPH